MACLDPWRPTRNLATPTIEAEQPQVDWSQCKSDHPFPRSRGAAAGTRSCRATDPRAARRLLGVVFVVTAVVVVVGVVGCRLLET